jgi:large subunit ribosomal protein L21e
MGMFDRTTTMFTFINAICNSRTGIVYNVTPHAVGVIVHKVVGNRYIEKRVSLRVEHVRHSACRQEFLDRVQANHAKHVQAKEKGGESNSALFVLIEYRYFRVERCASLKRVHALPRESRTVSTAKNPAQTIVPVRYETTI